jgi:regulator of protease activity HflC (stomatin/prohibitin superfamily)
MNRYDTEHLAELIRALPLAPEGWVRAAQELPTARRALDDIVARAEADAQYRAQLVADLESALAAEGIEPSPPNLQALRERLGHE